MKILLKNGQIITGKKSIIGDVLIESGLIVEIAENINQASDLEINCTDKYILPGAIDTHVHFRDPGDTHKGDAETESRAAITGGVTTICDMPSTKPAVLTLNIWQQKKEIYEHKCLCNFGLYMGSSLNNLEDLKRADENKFIPAIKVYMAESIGKMTLSEEKILKPLFRDTHKLIACHAENEDRRLQRIRDFKLGLIGQHIDKDDPYQHGIIRDNVTASQGTAHAIALAQEFNHRTHIVHVSTKEEIPLLEKCKDLVTSETAPHYLLFNREDIKQVGNYAVINPALKGSEDQVALLQALQNEIISQVATDHAPHLPVEKDLPYDQAPSGLPGIEFLVPLMLNFVVEGKFNMNQLVRLICENPARNYQIQNKGFLKEGFDADIMIVNPQKKIIISNEIVRAKCGWTPYVGMELKGGMVEKTIVNGNLVYDEGDFISGQKGKNIVVG